MKYNFGAGPGILPQEVLQEAARAVTDFNSSVFQFRQLLQGI